MSFEKIVTPAGHMIDRNVFEDIRGMIEPTIELTAEPRISLRDYFAGLAMQGVTPFIDNPYPVAKWCYNMADAMLQAREAGQ